MMTVPLSDHDFVTSQEGGEPGVSEAGPFRRNRVGKKLAARTPLPCGSVIEDGQKAAIAEMSRFRPLVEAVLM
jgi:hypothetical protein